PAGLHFWATFNPLAGIFSLYRSAFFPEQLDWFAVAMAAIISAIIFCVGVLVFARTERAVLKEI
ncbi:MAG TPA: ABC transporter permease, partial [Rhodoglobus sp.]|nr:ABC transporter permease [Rhodoglobus sp.]